MYKKPALIAVSGLSIFMLGLFAFGAGFDLPRCEALGPEQCGAKLDPIMNTGVGMMGVGAVVIVASLVWLMVRVMRGNRS